MPNLFTKKILIVIIFFLVIFLLPEFVFAADTSPDAIATRVIPNPDHLGPLRWYQANIKNQGSPQVLQVDGYEAVRDGRTVYVNAANIDLANNKFYTNIYLLSFSQNMEQATEDIFGQLLSHWKFNTNVPAEQKDKIRNDTKRLADLAEIKIALANYQKTRNGDFPSLSSGSYVAGKSISVWPSWQATLSKELGVTLPLDPKNILGVCAGYDALTCWNQISKSFVNPDNNSSTFDLPPNSQAYIYTYNGKGSYNICALMRSGYLTTLDQGACAGSAIGYAVDNCGNSEAGLGSFHKEGNQCVSNKKLNDPSCFYRGTGYDYGWKSFARIWQNGSWQTYCMIYNCQDNFYYINQDVFNGGIKVAQGDCQNCSVSSPAASVKVRNGCQNTQCANPCKITACVSGKHPSSDGLTCESNTAACAITGGVGEKQWQVSSNSWGACQATSCTQAADYYLYNGTCLDCNTVSGHATTIMVENGQCKVTVCESGYHPAANGLNCEADAAGCSPTCNAASQPNCQASALANSEAGSGVCCGGQICYKCLANYEWDGISRCKPKTQTVSCTAKPVGTEWNPSISPDPNAIATVEQTWSGSAWQPSNASSYDAAAGTCKFKCQTGYSWDAIISSCVAVPAACTPVDATLSGWSACSVSCGGGTQTRTCFGASCGGSTTCGGASLSRACNTQACCTPNCAATGHNCGDNGCSGSCGTCTAPNICSSGNCCPTTANIQICADNAHETYFNGTFVSSANDWGSAQAFNVNIISGKNVIAVHAWDQGLVFGFSATLNRPGCNSLTTNNISGWKCTKAIMNTTNDPDWGFTIETFAGPIGWNTIDYDDSSWPAAIFSSGGNVLPYGQIWASNANYSSSHIVCRYTFTAN